MIVKSDEPIYLRGNVKHIYTGSSWQSYEWGFKHKLNDSLSGLTYYERKSYFEEKSITIKNQNFATQTVFSPYLPDSFYSEKGTSIFKNNDHVLILPDGIYKYETYTIRVQKPYPYGVLLAKGIYNTKDNIENIDIYLQIPEDKITNEVKDLVKTIVKDKKQISKKPLPLKNTLGSNYEYSLDVKEVPEDAEFILTFI